MPGTLQALVHIAIVNHYKIFLQIEQNSQNVTTQIFTQIIFNVKISQSTEYSYPRFLLDVNCIIYAICMNLLFGILGCNCFKHLDVQYIYAAQINKSVVSTTEWFNKLKRQWLCIVHFADCIRKLERKLPLHQNLVVSNH